MYFTLKSGGGYYIWFGATQSRNFYEAALRAGLVIRQELVWSKSAFTLGKQDYQWKHELCLYGWIEGSSHYFINDRTQATVIQEQLKDLKKMKKEELVELVQKMLDEVQTDVIEEKKPPRSVLHPTMKPVPLLGRLITNSSKPGENVIDLFGGSGSTMIACEQLGRTCYMMELDTHFADVIIDRWEEFTGGKAELIGG